MRPTRDEMLMQMAHVTSLRGTCSRLRVGAVVAREGRILTQGYNGAPAGLPHCHHDCTCAVSPDVGFVFLHRRKCPSQQPCLQAEHAERNAIAFAARYGVGLDGAELFVTNMPCYPCAMSVINAGIKRVVYDEPYRLVEGIELLRQADVVVDQLTTE